MLVGRGVVELAPEMVEPLGKPTVRCFVGGPARAETQIAAERLVIHVPPGHADHGELFRQQPRASKIVKGRDKQALSEISGSAEYHEYARVSRSRFRLHLTYPPWARHV